MTSGGNGIQFQALRTSAAIACACARPRADDGPGQRAEVQRSSAAGATDVGFRTFRAAINLVPPSGPASSLTLPAPLTQPSITAPPVAAPSAAATADQAVLSLTARYGKDRPASPADWCGEFFRTVRTRLGTFKLIREDRGATPNIVLPPGNYVVHVALGLVSAVRAVTLKAETDRESFLLPAGGLRIEGRVGTSRIRRTRCHSQSTKAARSKSASALR